MERGRAADAVHHRNKHKAHFPVNLNLLRTVIDDNEPLPTAAKL